MAAKIINGVLVLITAYLNFKHGWSGISNSMSPEETKMMADIGIGKSWIMPISIVSFAIGILVLIPQTFFAGKHHQCRFDFTDHGNVFKSRIDKDSFNRNPFSVNAFDHDLFGISPKEIKKRLSQKDSLF